MCEKKGRRMRKKKSGQHRLPAAMSRTATTPRQPSATKAAFTPWQRSPPALHHASSSGLAAGESIAYAYEKGKGLLAAGRQASALDLRLSGCEEAADQHSQCNAHAKAESSTLFVQMSMVFWQRCGNGNQPLIVGSV
jgi:hypothetical protein